MLTKSGGQIPSSEITPRSLVIRRRDFLGTIVAAAGLRAVPAFGQTRTPSDAPTPKSTVTSYGNYYEFSSDKPTAYRLARALTTVPWTVTIEGLCAKPGTYALADLIKPYAVEERVYRMRCVEGWSMVIPWNGFPLASLLTRAEPQASAKFVEFTSLLRPQEMPGQRGRTLTWPYREGLRLDEAMHPLTILATGLYGERLLNQNGAPLRLVVPWRYGFKSIKSIVRIRFVDRQPLNTWQDANADYYGFYANVNPNVSTPSYSQAKERRLGEFFMRPTLMFNGYADQVAPLYSGMDLRRNF